LEGVYFAIQLLKRWQSASRLATMLPVVSTHIFELKVSHHSQFGNGIVRYFCGNVELHEGHLLRA
jgi:hypothetical protein